MKLRRISEFGRDNSGQDLIEYTLLMAFIILAAAAIFVSTEHPQKIFNVAPTAAQHQTQEPAK